MAVAKHRSRKLLVLLVLIGVAAVYVIYALLRPLPAPSITITPPIMPALVRVNIPWPAAAPQEQAAFGAAGYGLLATSGPEKPLPTASVAKVITALVVLAKKPLNQGEPGPSITLTARDVDLYNLYVAKDGSVLPVYAGETITEYQALQALLLPSANNIADTLVDWAFGDMTAYNSYANAFVRRLGMVNTTVTDASGFAATTVSTPSDLVRLGAATLLSPVVSEIVSQKSADFPEFGEIRNVNALLGQSGIRGIKTGNTDEAGGVFLGAADITASGKTITVITAVMGAPNLAQALRATLPLVQAAPSEFQTVRAVRAGQTVGKVTTAWGATSDIRAAQGLEVVAWSGTAVAPSYTQKSITLPAPDGTVAGSFALRFNGTTQTSDLTLMRAIERPSTMWLLQHPY